jgi:uncharacterized membrane protein HdeD (DUF308 family)
MTDNPHPVSNLARRLSMSAILFGLLTVILGVALLAWPGPSILVAAGLFGVYLVVSGVAMAASRWWSSRSTRQSHRAADF